MISPATTGVIIVDHGSRRTQSNEMLERVATLFGERYVHHHPVVEPAHMELAEPSIATAFSRCVARGATHVIIAPFFLGPGKHWTGDIPRLAHAAAAHHPGTRYHVTMPLGIDDLLLDLLAKRVAHCTGNSLSCDSCRGTLRSGEPGVELPADYEAHDPVQCGKCPFALDSAGTAYLRNEDVRPRLPLIPR